MKKKNFKIDKNRRNNTLLILAIVVGIILLSILLVFIGIMGRGSNNEESSKQDINNGSDKLEWELPDLIDVNPKINPYLYDFINGSLGYNTKESFIDYGFYYAILYRPEKINNDKSMYVSYYSYAETITRPILGNSPSYLHLTDEQIKRINDNIEFLAKNRIFYDNEYCLLIISQNQIDVDKEYRDNIVNYCDNIGRWLNIDFSNIAQNKKGNMYNIIYTDGNGWPLEWLNKEPYKEILKRNGYDLSNSFWKIYNIDSYNEYINDNGDKIKVYVDQLNRFKFKLNDERWVYLNTNQLERMLEENNYK